MKRIFVTFLLLQFFTVSYCQNGIHLVNTLIGEKVNDLFAIVESLGDVNGDGYKDFIVKSQGGGYSKLYLGGKPFDTAAVFRFNTQIVKGIGDVNGDGYDDLLIATGTYIYSGTYEDIKVYLLFGNKTLPFDSLLMFHKVYPLPCNIILAGLGDINGDGYADYAISNSDEGNGIGRCYLYLGGKTISSNPASVLSDRAIGGCFGYTMCGIGDINKDGYADFAISSPALINMDTSEIRFYYGGMQFDTIPRYIFRGIPGIGFTQIANVGDVNGDGCNDFMVSPPTGLYLHIDSIKSVYIQKADSTLLIKDAALGEGRDVNNDGYSDFIIGGQDYINSQGLMVGAAWIYFGGHVVDTVSKVLLTGEHHWDSFGAYVSMLGDINGDGYSEIAVGAPYYPDYNNPLGKVYIYSFVPSNDVNKSSNEDIPRSTFLLQNYPNPFNPSTIISWQMPINSNITLKIYNVLGEEIMTLVKGFQQAEYHSIKFNASNLPCGVYFYQLKTDKKMETKKMLLIK